MRRTLVVLTIVVLAVTLLATPGLAAGSQNRHGLRGGGGGQGSTSFNLLGTINTYDCEVGYIDVAVITPDKYGDIVLSVQTTGSTRFKECDYVVSVRIDCSDLVSGSQVRIMGTVDGESFVATRVIQYVPLAE